MNKNFPDNKEIASITEEIGTSSDMTEMEIGSAPETLITASDQEQETYLYSEFLEYATKKIKIRRFLLHKE